MKRLFLSISLVMWTITSTLQLALAAMPTSQVIFKSGGADYHSFRIPSIIVTQKGTVLAFCEARKKSLSDAGQIDLVMKRSTDNGQTWSPLNVVWHDGNNTCGNPCPVVDQDTGTIWLLATWNLGSDHEGAIINGKSKESRQVFVLSSKDDGQSWTTPKDITQSAKMSHWRWYATGPGVGIQLKQGKHKGRLIIPCDHSVIEYIPGQRYGSHVIYSDDHGENWKISDTVLPGPNECQAVELSDGRVMLNARNHRYKGSRVIAYSDDQGKTWTEVHYKSNLIEPRCQASLITYKGKGDGNNLLLFSNPNDSNKRIRMTVKVSPDDGKNWPIAKVIHDGPSAYSCLTVLDNGQIGCLFEAGEKSPYETITLTTFSYDWLTSSEAK